MVKYEGELEVMSISMIGIDHNMAPVDIRAKFAFTKKNAGEAMEKIKNQNGIYGLSLIHILIILMYLGRVGGLTLIYAVFSGRNKGNAKLPLEKITVG